MEAVLHVVRRLAEFNDEVVFVGGSVVPFLVPDAVAPTIRATDDVDCVVQAKTTVEYYRVADRLRALGFRECMEEGAPICRWIVDGIRVDVMPTAEAALGFHNRWYDEVVREPFEVVVVPDLRVRVASPANFLATKFEAFADRGHGDYMGDTDFEDIVTVLAYRSDVVDRVRVAAEPVRRYLGDCARQLLTLHNLDDLVGGCLPSDRVSQAMVPEVLVTLRRIAAEA